MQRNWAPDYGLSSYDFPQVLTVTYSWELPIRVAAHKWLDRAVGHWTLGGILVAASGAPLNISSPSTFNDGSSGAWANYLGGAVYGNHSSRTAQAANWLNPQAFCPANASGSSCTVDPNVGVTTMALGNTYMGIARGPGRFSNDISLSKHVPISERWGAAEIRLAFNAFNHTMLSNPDTNTANRNSTFGQITSARAPRNVQLAIRYVF
jgi:hypothetical protein